MSDISDIFISYKREDRPRVQRLAEVLAERGWSVWWDRDIQVGKQFDRVIEEQVKSARCVIVVWSKDSVGSDWVRAEATEARRLGKLVPVRIDDVDVPLAFQGIQTADLVGWEGDTARLEFGRLITAAGALIGGVPPSLLPPAERAGMPPESTQKLTLPARVARAIAKSVAAVVAGVNGALPGWAAKAMVWSTAAAVAMVVVIYLPNVITYLVMGGGGRLKIAVMQFPEAPQLSAEDAKILRTTRARLNSILSNIGAPELDVISPELMDLKCDKSLKELQCAQKLGIHKMIHGEMSTSNSTVSLEVHVVDLVRHFGSLEGSFECDEQPKNGLDKLQRQAAEKLLACFHVKLTPERQKQLADNFATGTSQDYNNLLDSLPVAEGKEEKKGTLLRPTSPERGDSFAWGVAIADAQQDPSPENASIKELLQQYQNALNLKSTERCKDLQVDMTDSQRDKLQRYFDNAEGLSVEIKISDTDIAVEGNEAVATFTRTDKFKEVPTGRDVHLEVRLSSLLTKQDGRWKIRGLKRPS